jgi:radical SAM-linked protein
MLNEMQQRFRITFRKGAEIKYISHLDLGRAWERALRRADVALAYSHGFSPHPRIFFASALPVGTTGRAEMLDIVVDRPIGVSDLTNRLRAQMPAGLEVSDLVEIPLTLPSLPAQVAAAEYEVQLGCADSLPALQVRLDGLLESQTLPRCLEREGKQRRYDLRPLIQRLWLIGRRNGDYLIGMLLRADAQGTGRPDEVMAALELGSDVRAIERTQLVLQP